MLSARGEGFLAVCPRLLCGSLLYSSVYSDLPYRFCRELSDRIYVFNYFVLFFIFVLYSLYCIC